MNELTGNGLKLLGIAVGFPMVALGIGHALLCRSNWLDRRERFAAAWGIGFSAIAASQFLAYLGGADPRFFHPAFLAWTLALAWLLGRFLVSGAWPREPGDPAPIGAWLLAVAHLALIQSLLPAYLGGGWAFDWWMHYEIAQVFLGHVPVETVWAEKYTIASRTPLMNLTLAGVISVAGDTFWAYQFASVLTNSVFILPLAMVAKSLAGPRAERLALLAAPLNIWLLHQGWFTWTKLLTAYYIFMSLHFYLRWLATPVEEPSIAWRRFLACWIASVLAFLTHQAALVYTAAMALHALWVNRRGVVGLLRPTRLATLGALAVGSAASWYAWLWRVVGASRIVSAVPMAPVSVDASASPWKLARVYLGGSFATFVPDRLIASLLFEPFSVGAVVIHLTALYFCQLPGALTLSLCLYLASRRWTGAVATTLDRRACLALLAIATLGGLSAILLSPDESRYGLAHNSLVPTTIAAIVWAWSVLSLGSGRGVRLACLGMSAEFLGVFWGHVAWLTYYRVTGRITTDLNWKVQNEYGLVFLNEAIGPAAPWLLGACLLLQVVLVRRLLAWAWNKGTP